MVSGNLCEYFVVFKYATSNLGSTGAEVETTPFQLFQQVDDSNNFAKGGRQCNVISLSGTECDQVLNFTSPYDQSNGVNYHVSGSVMA